MSNFSNMKRNFLKEKRTIMPRIFVKVVVIHSIFCDFFYGKNCSMDNSSDKFQIVSLSCEWYQYLHS